MNNSRSLNGNSKAFAAALAAVQLYLEEEAAQAVQPQPSVSRWRRWGQRQLVASREAWYFRRRPHGPTRR